MSLGKLASFSSPGSCTGSLDSAGTSPQYANPVFFPSSGGSPLCCGYVPGEDTVQLLLSVVLQGRVSRWSLDSSSCATQYSLVCRRSV